MEQAIVLILVAAFIFWLVWAPLKALYQRIFFKKLVTKHTGGLSPKAQSLSKAIIENDVAGFQQLADSASVNDIQDALRDTAEHQVNNNMIANYASDRPNDPVAQLLHGHHLVNKAWASRGSGVADTVTKSGWSDFETCLGQAEEALNTSIAIDPKIPQAHATLLTVQRGKGDMRKLHEVFESARSRFPTSFPIHQQMLSALPQRWSGNHGHTLEFARKNSGGDQTNRLQWLVAAAHLDTGIFEVEENASDYFKNKDIRREVNEAFKKYLTIDSTDQDYLDGLHYFAATFFSMLDKKNAKKAFKKLNGHYSAKAWSNWPDPNELFVRAKLWAT